MSQCNIQRQLDFYFLFIPLNKLTSYCTWASEMENYPNNIETAGVCFSYFNSNFQMLQHKIIHKDKL